MLLTNLSHSDWLVLVRCVRGREGERERGKEGKRMDHQLHCFPSLRLNLVTCTGCANRCPAASLEWEVTFSCSPWQVYQHLHERNPPRQMEPLKVGRGQYPYNRDAAG